MKTNLYRAPLTYAQSGGDHPAKGRHQPGPRLVRVYHCIDCRQTGVTLKNIGTHKKPVYICPACQKRRELLAKMRKL